MKITSIVRSKRFVLVAAIVLIFLLVILNLSKVVTSLTPASYGPISVLLTTTDQRNKLTPQYNIFFSTTSESSSRYDTITIDAHTTYQQLVGFGASLNGSSVWELEHKLTQQQRDALMQQFFDPIQGIGISLLRQPIGGSDQNAPEETAPNQYCSYDDNNGYPDDATLSHFSIAHDVATHTIGLLQQARQLNPQLRLIGSTWCVPQWMLTGYGANSALNPVYYGFYTKYLMKFIQAYAAHTLPIWGVTPQNEPLYSYANFGNNLTESQEYALIKDNLGPDFASNGIKTNILAYDHNWNHPEYPEALLNSPANQYIAGTAWHRYEGNSRTQTLVHNLYPEKGIFFTEDSAPIYDTDWKRYMPEGANLIIDVLRNWSQTYIQWTMASNPQFGPGSCTQCGADVYIDDTTGGLTYSLQYYLLGHFSKYVKPEAYRIGSSDFGDGNMRSVAFRNPDGSIVVVVYNDNVTAQAISLRSGKETFSYTLPAQAIATFRWEKPQGGFPIFPLSTQVLAAFLRFPDPSWLWIISRRKANVCFFYKVVFMHPFLPMLSFALTPQKRL